MAITFALDTNIPFPYIPHGPLAEEFVLITTTAGTITGAYTSKLSRVLRADLPGSYVITSGNVVTVNNLNTAAAVYPMRLLGYI